MNKITEASDLLKNGWCKGDLKDGDRYCAAGALAQAKYGRTSLDLYVNGNYYNDGSSKTDDDLVKDEIYQAWLNDGVGDIYDVLNATSEAKVIAEVILEQYPDNMLLHDNYANKKYSYVLFEHNDDVAESADDVIAIFDKAAMVWDETEAGK